MIFSKIRVLLILDSKLSDKCIDFTMMCACVFEFVFLSVITFWGTKNITTTVRLYFHVTKTFNIIYRDLIRKKNVWLHSLSSPLFY